MDCREPFHVSGAGRDKRTPIHARVCGPPGRFGRLVGLVRIFPDLDDGGMSAPPEFAPVPAKSFRRRVWSRRIASTRFAFDVAKYTVFGSTVSFGSCAMFVGFGLHGLLAGAAFGLAFGLFVGVVSLAVGVAHDGSRAVSEAMGRPVLTNVVEEEEGQLSMQADDPGGTVALSQVVRRHDETG